MKRTNVVLDEKLVAEAKKLTGVRTTQQLLDRALHLLVKLQRQHDILKLQGKVHWEGDLDEMRKTRTFT